MSDGVLRENATMCFACGVDNPIGLKIRFTLGDDGRCTAEFTGGDNHVGYANTIHGGIIYSALDDVMANVLYLSNKKAHTARCEVRYRRPLEIGQTIDLCGWIESERRRRVQLRAEARLRATGELVAESTASFMLV